MRPVHGVGTHPIQKIIVEYFEMSDSFHFNLSIRGIFLSRILSYAKISRWAQFKHVEKCRSGTTASACILSTNYTS